MAPIVLPRNMEGPVAAVWSSLTQLRESFRMLNCSKNGLYEFILCTGVCCALAVIFAYLLQASVDFKNKPGVSEFTLQMKTIISAASHNHYAHILYVIRTIPHLLRLTLATKNTTVWHQLTMKRHILRVFIDSSVGRDVWAPVTIALCRNMAFDGIKFYEMCYLHFHVIHLAPATRSLILTLLNPSGSGWLRAHLLSNSLCPVQPLTLQHDSRCTCRHPSQTHKRTEGHLGGGC